MPGGRGGEASNIGAHGLFLITATYICAIFALALFADRKAARASAWVTGPAVYALSLGVYCTAWSYFGSVGLAARSGLLYLPTYLGPILAIIAGTAFIRRLIAEKEIHRFTSVADLISFYYGKSEGLGALVAIISVIGVIPYIALQFKAINVTFDAISPGLHDFHEGAVVLLLLAGTILLGIRKLDPTERHPGLIVGLAAESVIKLLAIVLVGLVVVIAGWPAFVGLLRGEIALDWSPSRFVGANNEGILSWLCYLVISAAACLFLPRQFHVAVVENAGLRHVGPASWAFPLYLLLLTLFVLPIAALGLHAGLPASEADYFVIRLPLMMGHPQLAVLAYLGGFSAAAAMVMVETIAIATLATNHLALPVINRFSGLEWARKRLLQVKWLFATLTILVSYGFLNAVGEGYPLAEMGLISFVAAFQFAPATLGGLYWKQKSRGGAYAGLGLGFCVWLYTLFIPTFLRTTEWGRAFMEQGPFGWDFLRPYALFGTSLSDPVTHGFLWSAAFNILGYMFGSTAFGGQKAATDFTGSAKLLRNAPLDDLLKIELTSPVDALEKETTVRNLFLQYFDAKTAEGLARQCFADVLRDDPGEFSTLHLAQLHESVQNVLSGVIGSAAANAALQSSALLSPAERSLLARAYAALIAELQLPPSEISAKINFHLEREKLLESQARELRSRLEERDRENLLKNEELSQANKVLKESLARLRETQARLLETSKFSALGEMAGGIAHEINTPLATIQLLSAQLKEALDEEPQDRGLLKQMLDGVENTTMRIASIIRGLRTFSRDAGGDPFQTVELQKVIADTLSFCNARFRQDQVTVSVQAPADPVLVSGRSVQLSQVLLNLLNNSRDAIAKLPEKWIRVEVAVQAPRVEIAVIDSGAGIPPEVRDKMFQPFYTTKPVGVGTGLGLSVSKGIIEAHGGTIRIAENVRNTCIVVQLPVAGDATAGRGPGGLVE